MDELNNVLGSKENPIKCDDIRGQRNYLSRLLTINGEPVDYHREGSCTNSASRILDKYIIKDNDGQTITTLYLDMYHEGYCEKKVPEPLRSIDSFKVRKSFQEVDFFIAKKRELFSKKDFKVPDNYLYIWSKAGMILSRGVHIYTSEDALGLPNKDMCISEILKLCNQIVHQLKGINNSNPIEFRENQVMLDLLKTFHFESNKNQFNVNLDTVHLMIFNHMVTDEFLQLYLKKIK